MKNKAGNISSQDFMFTSKKEYRYVQVFKTPEEKLRESRKEKLKKISKNYDG